MSVEYRVRKINRFVITRYEESDSGNGSIETFGLFDNNTQANRLACAMSLSDPGSFVVELNEPEQCHMPAPE